MAKVVKSTRDMVDIDEEVKKVSSTKKKDEKGKKIESKKSGKKKTTKSKAKKSSFLKEVKDEIAKVKWPSRKDMVKYSFATICFVVFFGLFFYAIEAIMALVKAWV